jgi:DUF1009 family protein
MAKIHEEYVIVKVSKLVADNGPDAPTLGADVVAAIGEAAKELVAALVGEHVIVEVSNGAD